MMYEYIFVYIVLVLQTFFPYFFRVHLNILDTVVSS
jgi:hypothetical protein